MTSPSGSQAASPLAGPASWQLDPAGSSATFQHKTIWGLVTVRGTFRQLSGSGEIAADGSASGRLVIEAASLDTGHGARDRHLRSADFFDAANHPQIVVEISRAAARGEAAADIAGTLTVAGITRPITLAAGITAATEQAVTLTASGEFNRADFGMTWGRLGMIPGKAAVTVTARFTRAQ